MAVRSTDSGLLDQYFQDISDSKPLDSTSECELARRIQLGDRDARNELVSANLRFVVRLATDLQGCGMDLEDLISAGNVGLITAAERFDPERGVKFITYALWWIRQAILKSLSQDTRTVRLPANRVKLLNSITQISREIQQKTGVEPEDADVAQILEVPVDRVREMLMWSRELASLDQPTSGEDAQARMPLNVIPDDRQVAPDYEVSDESDHQQLVMALASLEDREAHVIREHYGLVDDDPKTLGAIGKNVGLTKERIRQIKEKALRKLRHPRHRDWLDPLRESIA
ncbi:MAG: RNA polymerase subunit sigma [Gemmatimonadetes bacterium]|jgi:RNA polymerase primary sigma factor|nr:RNA polymerase subunit sigma [Gemmatimonadota bacterium]